MFQAGPYSETAARISSVVDERAEQLRVAPNQRLRIERLLQEGFEQTRAELERQAQEARRASREVDDGVGKVLTTSSEEVERTLAAVMDQVASVDLDGARQAELAEHLATLDDQLAELVERESEVLGSVAAALQALDLRRNGDGLLRRR